ncbi:MAG: hypothetical protein COX78_00285 [Candidatus Levybacteria bacterium CG_4_10_14_0_2_um_filter_35_8]|nr:MAG: hypothetical protein COX78_00285 [Candidatus Levybacteria bacterium CG_4_10_14_0_2_um_filter_35_8]
MGTTIFWILEPDLWVLWILIFYPQNSCGADPPPPPLTGLRPKKEDCRLGKHCFRKTWDRQSDPSEPRENLFCFLKKAG